MNAVADINRRIGSVLVVSAINKYALIRRKLLNPSQCVVYDGAHIFMCRVAIYVVLTSYIFPSVFLLISV
jgi:hypothetical protein